MWYQIADSHVYLSIKAKPNAKQTKLVGLKGDRLKIMLKAPPANGKANVELMRFFAELFVLPKTAIEISCGSQSSVKRIRVPLCPVVVAFINDIKVGGIESI